jgi:mannose-6-phosphate isomerase
MGSDRAGSSRRVPSRPAPFRLAPWFSERVWGRRDLRPWYGEEATAGRRQPVGEAWLTGPHCVVETGPMAGRTLQEVCGAEEFPLLVKMLFPGDKLSVQVHPDDAQAQAMGQARGKTECWYVLEAEPGAAVGLGLKEGATAEQVRAAVGAGSLEDLMQWLPVSTGDMVFVDAGTIHAIGPGVVLLETQQTCDVTFRLYDYGRGRELHLEQGLAVMKMETRAGKVPARKMDGAGSGGASSFVRLIEQRYFVVDRFEVGPEGEVAVPTLGAGCLVGLKGAGTVEAEGIEPVELVAGRAVVVPEGCGGVRVKAGAGASFVRCFAPKASY